MLRSFPTMSVDEERYQGFLHGVSSRNKSENPSGDESDSRSLSFPEEEMPKLADGKYFHSSTLPNKIFHEKEQRDKLVHFFDPIGDLVSVLMETDLIKNSSVDLSFVVMPIVGFIGYIESNLDQPSSNSTFWSSRDDVEQCYFISFSPKSVFSTYTLTSFRCHIESGKKDYFCATLLIWDRDQIRKGEEEIIWQSEFRKVDDKKKSDDKNIEEFVMNVKLDTDKVYLIKIDVPKGTIICGDLSDSVDENASHLVNARARYYRNQYYFRDSYIGKVYEMAFTT